MKKQSGGKQHAASDLQVELRCILERCVRLSRNRPIIMQCGDEKVCLVPDLPVEVIDQFARQAHFPYVHVSNLGRRNDPSRIRWHRLRFAFPRRLSYSLLGVVCSLLPASEFKNTLYRAMGMRIGQNVEISLGAFLDPFSPRLISIGDDTVVGALSMLLTHAYRGRGRLFFGPVTIGSGCLVGAMALIGPGLLEDDVTVLPGVITLPFLQHVKRGSIIGLSNHPHDIREKVAGLLERLKFPEESGRS